MTRRRLRLHGARANARAAPPTSETNGAAAIPSATAVCPLAMPIATAIAKLIRRETDSISTRPPNSPKCWCPASQPRAK